MKLQRVIYELFESDLASLRDFSDWHEIDREIFLEFENGEKRYFSWCDEPIQYSMGMQDERFNTGEPDHILDVSNWDMWQSLIGTKIEFIDKEPHQIIEVKGPKKSVYLSNQEQGSWFSDVLHISNELPKISS